MEVDKWWLMQKVDKWSLMHCRQIWMLKKWKTWKRPLQDFTTWKHSCHVCMVSWRSKRLTIRAHNPNSCLLAARNSSSSKWPSRRSCTSSCNFSTEGSAAEAVGWPWAKKPVFFRKTWGDVRKNRVFFRKTCGKTCENPYKFSQDVGFIKKRKEYFLF